MLDAIITILIEIGLINPKFGKKQKEIKLLSRLFRLTIFFILPVYIALRILGVV